MDNKTVTIIILALCAMVILYYFFGYKKESLTNISREDKAIVDKLFTKFAKNPDMSFDEYADFLESIENTNLNLISNDLLTTFKTLRKRQLLTKEDIASAMKG